VWSNHHWTSLFPSLLLSLRFALFFSFFFDLHLCNKRYDINDDFCSKLRKNEIWGAPQVLSKIYKVFVLKFIIGPSMNYVTQFGKIFYPLPPLYNTFIFYPYTSPQHHTLHSLFVLRNLWKAPRKLEFLVVNNDLTFTQTLTQTFISGIVSTIVSSQSQGKV
jgi:hypothetical protein